MGTTTIQRERTRAAVQRRLSRHPVLIPALTSFALFALVFAIHFWLVWVGRFPGDQFAVDHFSHAWTNASIVQNATGFFSTLGTFVVAIPLAVITAIGLWRRSDRLAVEGLAIVSLAVVVNVLLKHLFGPSPAWLAAGRAGSNFPSGHVTFVTAVIGYLGILAWKRDQKEVAIVAALLVLGVGPARVIGGYHLVSDGVAGYLLGAAFVVAAFTWVSFRRQRQALTA